MVTKRVLAIVGLLVFAFVGFMLAASAVHEYVHYLTYKGLVKDNDNICLLDISSSAMGYYDYSVLPDKTDEFHKAQNTSEYYAYGATGAVFLLFIGSLYFAIPSIKWKK